MIELRPLLKIMFASGAVIGFISAVFFSIEYLLKGEYLNSVICLIFAPIVNGFFVAFHGLIALPIIRAAARRKIFEIDRVIIKEDVT